MGLHAALYLLIPGIRHRRASFAGWTDRLAIALALDGKVAIPMEYSVGFWRPRRLRRRLARELAQAIRVWNKGGVVPNLVTHSNGGVILCQALALDADIKVGTVCMVAPAAWRSMEQNGLNAALLTGRVQKLRIFASRGDRVLRYGGVSAIFSWLGKGYGRLGYDGPRDVDPRVAKRVEVIWEDHQNHGSWFSTKSLGRFIRQILA